jgi:hypothetical protein
MALINCPECGAQISDQAPTCPQCGFPIAPAAHDAGAPVAQAAAAGGAGSAQDVPPLPTERSAEPFRIAGRRVPIAALLFWGGMVVGILLKYGIFGGGDVPAPLRYVPYFMLFGGVLWFAVTEFTMIIRNRKRR